jgi:hypothetical protein
MSSSSHRRLRQCRRSCLRKPPHAVHRPYRVLLVISLQMLLVLAALVGSRAEEQIPQEVVQALSREDRVERVPPELFPPGLFPPGLVEHSVPLRVIIRIALFRALTMDRQDLEDRAAGIRWDALGSPQHFNRPWAHLVRKIRMERRLERLLSRLPE